ncbi:MAG: hypothetical protein K2G38_03795 [Clostridia bacterium]|nr:hypothetical protein [Clostridia bacterium]
MKLKTRKNLLTVLLSVLCAVLLFCSVGLLSTHGGSKIKSATAAGDVIKLDSGNDSQPFSGKGLAELYDAILRTDYKYTGTYSKVVKLIDDDGTNDIYASDKLDTIVVTLGGLEWYVVALSKVDQSSDSTCTNGDVVATLWLKSSGPRTNGVENENFCGYADYYDTAAHHTDYPNVMYSTSMVRAVYLNNGGEYTHRTGAWGVQQTAAVSTATPSSSNKFAKFTMSSSPLYKYIVAPANIHYQEVETFGQYVSSSGMTLVQGSGGMKNFDSAGVYPNDAYSSSITATANGNGGPADIAAKPLYSEWKNDKIWLPSATEVGDGGNGVWKCTSTQRTNDVGDYQNLRTGQAADSCRPVLLSQTGAFLDASGPTTSAVRPALHLNLATAEKSAVNGAGSDAADFLAVNTPTDLEFTYDGIEYTKMEDIIKRVEEGKQKSPADANGDTNNKKEIKWYDKLHHPVSGNAPGDASNTIYKTGSAIEYKIEYKQAGKTTYASPMTDFKIKNAGEYKITCYFEPDHNYKWRDINTGALSTDASKEFKITVKQLEVKYKWKSSGGKLNETSGDATKQWKVTFDKDTFTPTAGNSAAPWVYLDYTLLTTVNSTDNANAALLTYDQAAKKSMLGTDANDTLPCIVVKYVNTEGYDAPLQNIYVNKNGTTAPTNGTSRAFPQEAGNYTVTAEDINKNTSNYKLVPDSGEPALTSTRGYEIEKYEVQAPIKPASPLEYNGSEQEYRVPNYNDKYMEYGTYDGTTFTKDATPTDMTSGTSGADAPLTVKATKVNDYKVSFQLLKSTVANNTNPVVRNYKWKSTDTSINGTTNVWTVNYAIQPKTLEFDFTSSVLKDGNQTFTIKTNNTDGKLTYSYKASASPVNSEEPVLELYYAVSGTSGAGSINPNHATEPTEFLYKNLKDSNGAHKAGKYVIYVVLASSSANPVNKNYRIKDPDAITAEMTEAGASASDIEAAVKAAKATYEKEITLTAGEASLNDLPIVYKEGNDITNSDAPTELSFDYDGKKNLQYKLGSDGRTPVVYWIYFDLSDEFSFLEVVGSISYQYDAPATDTTPCNYDPYGATGYAMRYAGKLTITVKVKVKDSEKSENKLPTQAEYDALTDKKFTYTAGTADSNGNVYDGELVFTYVIRKAEVDADKIKDTTLLQWKYSTEDDTKWKNYTDTSFPEYNEIAMVDFRINPSKYNTDGNGTLAGITGASLDSITNGAGNPEKQGPGKRFVTIAYTVDENNYEKVNHDNNVLSGKYKYEVEISPKIIDSSKLTLTTWKDTDGETDKTNSLGVPYQIWELDLENPSFANFIEYEYYLYDAVQGTVGTYIGKGDTALLDLTNPGGPYAYLNIDAGSSAYIYVKPVINQTKVDKVNGEPKYALKDLSGNTDKDADGNDGYKKFEFGKQMTVIKVELVKEEIEYGTAFTAADIIKITMGGNVAAESTYNTAVYKDKIDEANLVGDLASFCTNSAKLDAGKYIIKVTAVNEDLFVAVPATVNFAISPKEVELPTLGEIVFTGSGLNLADFLGGSWDPEAMTLGGDFEDIRNVSKSGYSATITLKNANYRWKYEGNDKVKIAYSLSDYEINQLDASTAVYKWNIAPLVIDTTKLWNKGNKGATLNLPQNVKDLIAAGTLEVGYRYYDGDGNFVESPEIKGGKSFKVEAVFGGDDAVRNVQFKTGDTTIGNTSPAINYTVPQSGMQAFGGKVLSFLKNYWWWILIALAILILLIILIVVIAKRRKNKEEREEKKRQKEEEKERREEEKRRREEEREEEKRRREEEREREKAEREAERERQKAELEAEKERQKAELELAKAKQEAELAKMKAEAAVAAGIAATAVAEQPKQEVVPAPVQQPQPQVQYVQQQPAVDPNALARLEAEMAAMRAENKAMHQSMQQQQQMPVAQPMMMPMQQPMMQMPMQMQQPMMQMPMMQQPSYGPMPQQMPAYGGSADNGALARVEAQLNALQAQQRAKDEAEHRAEMSAMRAEMKATKEAEQTAEFAALRNQMLYGHNGANNAQSAQPALNAIPVIQAQPQQANNNNPNSMDMLGALVVAALKNIAEPKANESKAIEQRIVEAEPPVAVNTPTVYPPDAVVTTTTRVDTTKPQPQQTRSRDDGRLFDVDGFYDTFDGNK